MADALHRLDNDAQNARFEPDHIVQSAGFTSRTGYLLFLSDMLSLAGGIVGGFWLAKNVGISYAVATPWPTGLSTLALSAALPLALLALFWLAGHYGRRRALWDTSLEGVLPITVAMTAHAVLLKTTGDIAPLVTVVSWVFGGVVLFAARRTNRDILARTGRWHQPAIIIGSDAEFRRLDSELAQANDLAIRADARLERDPAFGFDISAARLAALVSAYPDHKILISPWRTDAASIQNLLNLIAPIGRRVSAVLPYPCLVPALDQKVREHYLPNHGAIVTPRAGMSDPVLSGFKRAVDIVGSLFFLTLFAPLFGLLSIAGLFDRGPVFFSHRRVGRYGRPFSCYKFRTMVPNGEKVLEDLLARDPVARQEWETSFKLKNDPRVTRLGGFLRKTSLDELPQLWNVLKGDMSLVGPRPIIENELRYYGDHTLEYFSVRPGMTGLWQISGRSNTSYETRVELDTLYVRNWSISADFLILFKTADVVFGRGGAY